MSEKRLRPGLIALWGGLLVLVVVIVGREFVAAPERPSMPPRALLAFAETDLGSIEVLNVDRRAALTRDATGKWFLHDASHSHSAGDQAALQETHRANPEKSGEVGVGATVAAAIGATETLQAKRPLDEYGLANPKIIIAYYGRDGTEVDYRRPLATLYVGKPSPGAETYFASIDDQAGITLIVRDDIDRLLDLMFAEAESTEP